jgi:integrase
MKAGSVTKYLTKAKERLWRYRFDADPTDDGKRQVISRQGYDTRGAAMTAMQDAIEAHRQGKIAPPPPPPPKQTVADWVRHWLQDYAPHQCTPKTVERYWQLAGYVLNATEGEPAALAVTPLAEVKHTHVESALRALLRMPAKRKEHLSPKSVREIAGVLSVSLNEAFRLDMIPVNPLLKVKLPKVERKEARALAPEEVQRLRDVCRGDWTFPFLELAFATGCRRGELLALTWPDIDYMNATVTISKSIEETKAGLRVKRPKSGKVRKFRIGQTAVTALRFLQDEQKQNRLLFGSDFKDHLGLVFCQPDGSHLSPVLVSQTIVRRLKKAGIKDASLHTTRHTHASALLSHGVPLPAVSTRLGHADVAITARIYAHALPADDERCAEASDRCAAEWETPAQAEPEKIRGPVQ